MKEQRDDNGTNLSMDDAIAQLHNLSELQMEISAKKDLMIARGENGQAPAPPPEEPQTPKEKLMNQMVKERQAKNGIVTANEKKALSNYIDAKVAALGPNATVSDLSPTEMDDMVGYAKNVDEDMLCKRQGVDRVKLGPVQKAVQNVPFITTPDYPDKPTPPVDPDPDSKEIATEANKPQPPEKPSTWYMGKEATQKAMEKYEQDQKKYEEDLKKWEANIKYQEECKQYNKDYAQWKKEVDKADEQSRAVEKALALGVMKTDYDPETGKYTFAFMDKDGNWQVKECKDAAEAKMRAYKAIDKGLVNPKIMNNVPVDDDMLAAIATGDLKVEPEGAGDAVKVSKNVNPNGEPEYGSPEVLPTNDPDAMKNLGESTKGYQDKNKIKYKDIDGRAYDSYDEKEKLSNGTTDKKGVRRCSACGREWPKENGGTSAPSIPGVSDIANAANSAWQTATNAASDAADAAIQNATSNISNAIGGLIGGGGGLGGFGAVAPRGIGMVQQKVRYRTGYKAWEKVDVATQLTKASLSSIGSKRLSRAQVSGLMKHINMLLCNDNSLVERFISSLTEACSSTSSINHDNVDDLVHGLSNQHSLTPSLQMFARTNVCPLCKRELPTPTLEVTEELAKAKTTFKGQLITDKNAEKIHGKPYTKMGGLAELLRDGTQQAFNPFIDQLATWTKFSYRPTDNEEGYPIIRIIPASFKGMANINLILNTTPYVVVSEYFMRNNVSSAVNLFQAIMEDGEAQDAEQAGEPEEIKAKTTEITEAIKNSFEDLKNPAEQVLDMPFVLYHRLKAKLYGNRYVFPYVPKDNALSTSSNAEEWGGEGLLATLTNALHSVVNNISGVVGIGINKPFPAPTWKLPDNGTKWEFTFDLNLLNDEYIRARNNYMCSNTIINNNRWIQKTILGFPGALYEVLVPTGVRELMCTGSFTLKALGVNRHIPVGFFDTPFKIGSQVYKSGNGKSDLHSDAYEVVPDAYALNCKFQSCITDNLNNSIFAYYLKITDFAPGTPTKSAFESLDAVAPWASAAIATEKVDDAVAIQKTVADVKQVFQGNKEAKAAKEAAAAAQNAANNAGTNQPPDPTGGKPPVTKAVARRSESPMLRDEMTELYSNQYANLRNKLAAIKDEEVNKQKTLHELLKKSEELPLGGIRKTYAKRIAKVKKDIRELMKKEKDVEDSLIKVEITLLLRAKDKVEERANSDMLVVPRGYFDPYELDEVTALKIKYMTRDELSKFIDEQEAHLCAIDKWGIHNCRDFWIRAGVIDFIADAMIELEDLIRDTYETDQEQHDKYRYRYDMLSKDLEAVTDPTKPFILNRTNLIYIDPAILPQELSDETEEEEEAEDVEQADSSTNEPDGALVETGPMDDLPPAIIEDEDGSLIVDREELIKQHRAEVVKQVFGNEDGLAAAAFKKAIENETNPAARYDRDALVMLKNTPDLDDEPKLIKWFHNQEGEMYQNVWRRMIADNPDIAIFPPEVDRTKVTRAQAIFYLTQDLYRYVSSARVVLLGNAMDTVDTKATKVLNRVTNQFQRLAN